MSISFDKALGIHQQALEVRVQRAEVLASNLANADTPGYKARDMDFKAILGAQMDGQMEMMQTNGKHLPVGGDLQGDNELLYRNPLQPSLDGNTVDTQFETAEFMQNSMDYEASFLFLNNKFKGLVRAIKGE